MTTFESAVDRMLAHLNANLHGMYALTHDHDVQDDEGITIILYSSNDEHSDVGIPVLLLPMEWTPDGLQLTIPVTDELRDLVVKGQ